MRICVITAGHLSTSPRMLKAADALAAAGHDVRVVSTRHMTWATATDTDLRRTRHWDWTLVDYSADSGGRLRAISGVRHHFTRAIVRAARGARVPYPLVVRAFARTHDELVTAALAKPADFFFGGTTGALAATAAAARIARVPFGVDLEDFHRGQHEGPEGRLTNELAARVEDRVIPAARCVVASSGPISDEYARVCGVRPITVHNAFPLPKRPPELTRQAGRRLRLYWFSQTIGSDRGLDEVITALGIADIPALLALRGRPVPGCIETLVALARRVAPGTEIEVLPPASPDSMVELCRGFDVGLAVEQPTTRNRELCLSNKALTYILAGLAVVLTDTEGQNTLARDLAPGALRYLPGCPQELADGLRRWATNPAELCVARRAAWAAAERRWHWEHTAERGALIAAIEGALP